MNTRAIQHTHSNLPRLNRQWYRGTAAIFWTHSVQDRATGWLDDRFHHLFREVLLHACGRYGLICPVYTLMPDHFHLVAMGICETSDQWIANAFLRKHLKPHFSPASLQDRAYDHILRKSERERDALMAICRYIRENPVRANFCQSPAEWKYAGAIVPGYPEMDPNAGSFWDDFWKIHNRLVADRVLPAPGGAESGESLCSRTGLRAADRMIWHF